MKDESFKDFVLDQLADVPELRARKMFGGWGLYGKGPALRSLGGGGKFFGIISDGVLYFKTNPETSEKYREYGMKPFAPSEKQILKNYYEVPADILENPEMLAEWAVEAVGI